MNFMLTYPSKSIFHRDWQGIAFLYKKKGFVSSDFSLFVPFGTNCATE